MAAEISRAIGSTSDSASFPPIFSRCFFARPVGHNKSGEIWQELWVDGVKKYTETTSLTLNTDN